MAAVAHLPASVDALVDSLLNHALGRSTPDDGADIRDRLHLLTSEARRLAVPLDALVFALRDGWLRALERSHSAFPSRGERFVRVAHACIREYLRADARPVIQAP